MSNYYDVFAFDLGSTRCAALSLLMAIIVLYGTYTAAITSELSDIQVHMPFLNLHQMYTETETKVGTVKGTVITEIFKVSKMLAHHTMPLCPYAVCNLGLLSTI